MARETIGSTAVATLPSEDEALVEQVREGDPAAFGQLVRRYQDRVINTCWRICGNAEDAEDLAQEAFLHALQAIGSFERESRFYTWLFRIAVNVSITHARKQAKSVALSLHDRDGQYHGDHQAAKLVGRISTEADPPPAKLSAQETQRRLLEGLARLDDDHRTVVVLRDIEGMDYQQIADVLKVPKGTVKSRLHRARMELRERLEGRLEARG